MADIDVKLSAKGGLAQEANRASKAMASVADEEKRVQDIAQKLSESDLKKVRDSMRAVRKETKETAVQASKAQQSLAKSAASNEKRRLGALKLQTEKRREAVDVADKLLTRDIKGLAELSLVAGAAVGLAAGFVAANVAAVSLVGTVAKMAAEAGESKQSAEAMFRILEGSNAEQALEAVDSASKKMGVSLEKGRERFIKFRQAGADNSVSVALSKLTADLDAVDPSGRAAEQAVERVLAQKNDDGTANLAAMHEEMAKVAAQAGVAGDGAEAMAAKVGTVGGAMTRIDTAKTEALEEIWERIGPTVVRVAQQAADAIEKFLDSAEGQEAMDDIVQSVGALAEAAETLIPDVIDLVGTLAGLARTGSEITSAILRIRDAFSAVGESADYFLVKVLGLPEGVAGVIKTMVTNILDPLGLVSDGMPDAAADMIDGLIDGLSPSKLLGHMRGLASSALDSFKSTLGIASPSKAFMSVGTSMGEGTTMGFSEKLATMPELAKGAVNDVESVPAPSIGDRAAGAAGDISLAPALAAPALAPLTGGFEQAPAPNAPGIAGGAGAVPDITINVSGAESPAEVAREVRREIQALLSAERLAKGAAA